MRHLFLVISFVFSLSTYSQSISLVKDIINGSGSSYLRYFVKAMDNKVYFFATNPLTNNEALYVTDGTESGTIMLLDNVYPTATSNALTKTHYITFNGNFCFWGRAKGENRSQLWFTNGTLQGTYSLTNFTVNATIKSLLELNNKIYFFATFTSPDAIYVSNLAEKDAVPLITLSNDQRQSSLIKYNNKLYRIARYEVFEITNNTETLIYSDLSNCIGEYELIGSKLVFNKRSCSTVDPLYKSTESLDLSTGNSNTISSTIPLGNYSKANTTKSAVLNGFLYCQRKNLIGDTLYIYKVDGNSILPFTTLFLDGHNIETRGYITYKDKLYFSVEFIPKSSQWAGENKFRLYEVTSSGLLMKFFFFDKIYGYITNKDVLSLVNNKLIFRADTFNTYTEKSNLLLGDWTFGNDWRSIKYANNPDANLFVEDLVNLNDEEVLIAATIYDDNVYIGKELYKCNINAGTTTGIYDIDQLEYKLFPNPGNTVINIISSNRISSVSVLNMQGQVVLSSDNAILNIESLPPGTYVINFSINDSPKQSKFIKY
jgi:ELWxxDGT repeat protein